jgi:hypothetical protein
MIETVEAERWLYAKLSGDSVLNTAVSGRIYAYEAPEGAAFPYVVFGLGSPQPDKVPVGAPRIWSSLVYDVKVVGETSDAKSLQTIANRIDAVLDRQSGNTTNATVVYCGRQLPISMRERYETKSFHHLGGQFRLFVQ